MARYSIIASAGDKAASRLWFAIGVFATCQSAALIAWTLLVRVDDLVKGL
jgi:hypothetical protein